MKKLLFIKHYDRSRFITYIAALTGLTVVLLLRRTFGIVHDSVLYLGQGLLCRYPEIFSKDMFFLHGGQDRYTIFPWLLGQMLHWVDPLPIFMLGTLIGLLLFTAASWYCLKALLPSGQRYVAWIGVLSLPTMYGYTQVFSYSEAFFTMRTYAEALCLLAIIFVVRNCWISAITCIAISGALHPLQMLVVLPTIWLWLVMKDRRWLHALWLLIPLAALAFAKVHPFSGLFEQADPFWLMTIRLSPHLFITLWSTRDYIFLVFDILVLVLISNTMSSYFNVFCRISLINLVLGIIGSFILADWLNLVLPIGLQLWRTHWLAHWFAMASFALLLLKHWREEQWHQAILLMLMGILAWSEENWIWMGVAAIYLIYPWLIAGTRIRLKSLLGGLFGLVLGFLILKHIVFQWKFFSTIGNYDLHIHAVDYDILSFPPIALGLPLLGLYLWSKTNKYKPWLLILMLLPAFLWGVSQWDMRSDTKVSLDYLINHNDIFGVHLPEDAQIYWDLDSPIDSWYILRRAHYYSFLQAAGQVFGRGTAVEGYDRWLRLRDMNEELIGCKDDKLSITQQRSCHISETALYKMCSPSLPPDKYPPPFPAPPDYLVLPLNQPQGALGQWPIYDTYNSKLIVIYYLYSCTNLMDKLQIPKELAIID